MRKYLFLVGLVLLAGGSAAAQDDYPKFETAPAIMYIRVIPGSGASDQNCIGAGGTFAVNMSKWVGIAADLGGCKITGLPSGLSANVFTYLFGPRFTYRNNSRFTPFFLVNFGGARLSADENFECDTATRREAVSECGSASTNAFAMTVGGGFDVKLTKKISWRPIQAEYLYTRFGNNFFNNSSQNNFRLKSGIVINWGGGS